MSETCEFCDLTTVFLPNGTFTQTMESCTKRAVGTVESGLRVCFDHQMKLLEIEQRIEDGTLGIPRSEGA